MRGWCGLLVEPCTHHPARPLPASCSHSPVNAATQAAILLMLTGWLHPQVLYSTCDGSGRGRRAPLDRSNCPLEDAAKSAWRGRGFLARQDRWLSTQAVVVVSRGCVHAQVLRLVQQPPRMAWLFETAATARAAACCLRGCVVALLPVAPPAWPAAVPPASRCHHHRGLR